MLCGHDGELRRYLYLDERGEWRRRTARSCFLCRLVVKNLDLHAVRVVFAAVCGDCPVFSTPTNPRVTLQTKLGWSGARAVMVVVLLCFTVIFRVHLSPRAV